MAIPEAQLVTWSNQGAIQQSAATYQTIKNALEDPAAPYHNRGYSIFLQGSYGNDTNVIRESDVDIVICLDEIYYSDLARLNDGARGNYDRSLVNANYSWIDFRREVLAWLLHKFGHAVTDGNKAINIAGNAARRDADVLVCCKFRRWAENSNGLDNNYWEGICFWSRGNRIENFPKLHMANCTTKHQATNTWFKHVVRIYKNMRNHMVNDGVLNEGVAPSYFIEGMLWNVPNDQFGNTFQGSFLNTYRWVAAANSAQLVTANQMHWLVRDGVHTSWPTANFNAYLEAVRRYWDNWR